ncbi:MAG: nuclear transport factor 2 family protein [Cyanobacteria bacterium J06626_14]
MDRKFLAQLSFLGAVSVVLFVNSGKAPLNASERQNLGQVEQEHREETTLTAARLPLTMNPPHAAIEALAVVAQSAVQADDEAEIRQLTTEWFAAWSPGQGSVDWDAMGELFVQEPDELLVFDDAGGSVVVLTSWEDYRATWEPFMEQFTEWQIEPEGEIHVNVDGDLAATVFTLTGGGIDQNQNPIEFRQRATHIWQRKGDRWLIVHEHLTTDN